MSYSTGTSPIHTHATAKPSCKGSMRTNATMHLYNPASHHHASTWQSNLVALRQGDVATDGTLLPCDKVKPNPAFRPSDSAFDAVAEAVFTYGKVRGEGKGPSVHVNSHGAACSSEKNSKDKRQNGSWVRNFVPKAVQPCYPEAASNGNRVAVWQCDRVAVRFYVTIKDKATQEERQVPVTLTTNTVSVLSYGTLIEFSLTNRSKGTFGDSRDVKRHPLSFAKSELRRILGASVGDAAYAALVTLPPKCPTTKQPSASVAGSQAVGSQGSK